MQRLAGHRIEGVEDEQRRSGVLAQLGSAGLAPVPAAAGHPGVVAPHHLARIGMLDHRDSSAAVSKGSVPTARISRGGPGVAGQVLPTDRDLVQH
jgi:hypothetical protein